MRALTLAVLLCLPALPGCEENLDPATPAGAMHQLRDAVMARDANALLARSSAATHQRLAELHTLLKEQRQAIAERYPDEHRAAARTAYPPEVLEAHDTGALFRALVAKRLEALETSDGLRYGLTVMGTPAGEGERVQVSTQSGETFEFVLEDGRYVTTAFERVLGRNLERARVYQQTLTENLKVFEELKRREANRRAKEEAAAPGSDGAPGEPAAPAPGP
ncbi:MAG: hypothetical protein R3F60_15320 [bacterium]